MKDSSSGPTLKLSINHVVAMASLIAQKWLLILLSVSTAWLESHDTP